VLKIIREDVQTVFARDPAARSLLDVLFCYPGLHALLLHRVASFLWRHRVHLPARLLSHVNRFLTGVEIHPGAKIGKGFFLDHGTGVVIGETAEIGDDVLMYQGVVLGGTSLEKRKHHPTIENNVVLGAAAILLGPVTVGEGARVGANSVVVKSVPPSATIVGVPERIVEDRRLATMDLEHGKLPDPVNEAIGLMLEKQGALEDRVEHLERLLKGNSRVKHSSSESQVRDGNER